MKNFIFRKMSRLLVGELIRSCIMYGAELRRTATQLRILTPHSFGPRVARPVSILLGIYLRFGAAAGLDPNPSFSSASYLIRYPDIASLGVNPLLHYRTNGRREGA